MSAHRLRHWADDARNAARAAERGVWERHKAHGTYYTRRPLRQWGREFWLCCYLVATATIMCELCERIIVADSPISYAEAAQAHAWLIAVNELVQS